MKTNKIQEQKDGYISAVTDMNGDALLAEAGGDVSREAKSAQNDDLVRLREENERLRATIRNVEAHRRITGELERVGARSPELLYEAVKSELEFGSDGGVTNAAAVVERLRRKFPEQFKASRTLPSIDAGAGTVELPSLTKEALAKMKPAEIAKLDWEEVKRTLAA